MPSCNVAVNHRADTATDNRTQSCLSVFSQSPPPPPPQLQVVVGGAAKTMRESTFKVNWASRLLGRKWKWKWRILDYSLFVFFYATSSSLLLLLRLLLCRFGFVWKIAEPDELAGNLCSAPRRVHFCLLCCPTESSCSACVLLPPPSFLLLILLLASLDFVFVPFWWASN